MWLFPAIAAILALLPSGARSEELPLSLSLTPRASLLPIVPPSHSSPAVGSLLADSLPDPPAGRLPLRLVWFDVHEAVPFAYEPVVEEVTAIFRDLGVRVVWRRGEVGTITTPDEVQVILLATPVPARAGVPRTMGATRRSPGAHAVWIFLRNVTWALGHGDSAGRMPSEDRDEVGLALARVVAHELIHAMIPDEPHAKRGLMADKMGRSTLLQPGLKPDPRTQRAFSAAIARRQEPIRDRLAEVAEGIAAQR